MKKSFLFPIITLVFLLLTQACGEKKETPKEEGPKYKHTYETVDGDPMNTMVYTLSNGLKVYMSLYDDEPRLMSAIAVRAGSKNDPADATGLAHYLEHMLFKGSSEIATIDWAKEKPLLDLISDLYEQHRNTDNEEEKRAIYARIDSASHAAAAYSVPNEYDKMISSLGAKYTNAFTSYEQTVYINDIPSNELEKWLMVESARFKELTLRLFHTELETVYEEFNRGQDNDYSKVYHAIDKLLYQKHPYGTQTTIGEGEHLKNPSMVKIHEYFDTYYNPNNIAICLAGDMDPDATVDMIEKYFGSWEKKEIPTFTSPKEDPITEPRVAEVLGPNSEWVTMSYRFDGVHSDDAKYLRLLSSLLYNGQAGLIDLNLIQQQKVLSARAYEDVLHDYSSFTLSANPREGQDLQEVRDMLIAQIEKVKNGEFDDWMLDAVIKNMKKDEADGLASNFSRCFNLMDAFILRMDWADKIKEIDESAAITKQQLIDWTKKSFGDNYVIVYKRTGEDPNIHKVDKPSITPLDINRDTNSTFFNKFSEMAETRVDPVFVDYKTMISSSTIKEKVPFSYIQNTVNKNFTMYYLLDMGKDHNPKLGLAVSYLPYLGTDKYSAEELQKEFFKLGLTFDVFAGSDRVYVYLSGLEESLEEGTKLFEHMLANAKANPDKLKELISDEIKERVNAKKSKGSIMRGGLANYAKYGAKNPFNTKLTEEELMAIDAQELVDIINSFTQYKHRILYYGNMEQAGVEEVLDRQHTVAETLMDYPEKVEYAELETTENKVLYVDYDMVQTEMMFISKGGKFDKTLLPYANLFNEYFGSGLSSIVFQEIREGKALAYSAFSSFQSPGKKEDSHYVRAYVGTQTDKLGDAVDAMLELMNDMPKSQDQFESARMAALKKIETDRITKSSIFWNYEAAKRRGLDSDIRKDNYEKMKDMNIDDLDKFFVDNIKGRNYTFLVIGKRSEMDMEALEKLGPVQELTLEELFGY